MFIPNLGWISSACFGASATVYANAEAKIVYLISDTLDTRWKFCRIGNDLAGGIIATRFDSPTIINYKLISRERNGV